MNNTILITGASSGIGRATARHFQANGWNVIATMRKPDNETELTELDNVLVTHLDVQDTDSIQAAVAEGIERFGRIDVLLNNAGYGAYGPLEATPTEKIKRQFDVNVIGLYEATKGVLPHFRANRAGMVINISSIGGRMTFPFGSLYHGTKWAVEGISEALRWELNDIGIQVKIVEPGFIRTDFGGRSFDFTNDESMAEYQPLIGKLMDAWQSPEGGSQPELVAEVIFNAATDGEDTLRYTAGPDADMLMGARDSMDYDTFVATVRGQMGF